MSFLISRISRPVCMLAARTLPRQPIASLLARSTLQSSAANFLQLQHFPNPLRNFATSARVALDKDGGAQKVALAKLRGGKKAVMAAMAQDGGDLKFAPSEWQADKEVVLAAVAQNGKALKFASEDLRADKEVVLAAVAQNGWALLAASEDLRADKEVVLAALAQYAPALRYASDSLLADKEFMLAAVAQHGVEALGYASDSLLADKEFMLAAVAENGGALEYASKALKADKEVVMVAVAQKGWALQHASADLRADKEVVLAGVAQSDRALFYASYELRGDREVVLAAVAEHGTGALKLASASLRADKELMLAAVAQHGVEALRYASDSLLADKEFMLAAVAENGWALEYASKAFKADKEVVMVAVAQKGSALQHASADLRADKEVVLAGVAQSGWALFYASDELRGDREVVLVAVAEHGTGALKLASASLRADKELMLTAVAQDGLALELASAPLRGDKEVVMVAVAQDGRALKYASTELQMDPQLIITAGLQIAKSSSIRSANQIDEELLFYIRGRYPEHLVSCIKQLYLGKDTAHAKICKKITEYRNREIGLGLLLNYSEHFQNPGFAAAYKTFTDSSKGKVAVHTLLPAIHPAKWVSQSTSSTQVDLEAKKNIRDYLQVPGNRDKFKKIDFNLTPNFLLACNALDRLNRQSLLTPEQALIILGKTCQNHQSEDFQAALIALTTVADFAFSFPNLQRTLISEGLLVPDKLSLTNLNSLIDQSISNIFSWIRDLPEEEFVTKYKATFGSITFPNALMTYALGLRNQPGFQSELARFIRDVLLSDNQSMYDIKENLSLKTIQENAPEVLKRWKQILKPLSRDEYVFDEIDNPLTRFDTMTAGPRSCLSVDSGSLNKLGLLSACGDGNIHILRVKDRVEKVIGRALLRLAVNNKEQPLLILERVYSHHTKECINRVIEDLATQKADQLGIPLITKNHVYNRGFEQTQNISLSVGGQYGWYHSDIVGGLARKEESKRGVTGLVLEYMPQTLKVLGTSNGLDMKEPGSGVFIK